MKRQQERVAKGLKMWAVIDEAALARLSGSPDILGGQLEQLLAVKPPMNVTIQLLPFQAGIHPGQYGSFIFMEFAEPNPDVVWVEGLTNSVYFEDEGDVDRYAEAFDHLRARALGPPQSRTRLRSMLKELKCPSPTPLTSTFPTPSGRSPRSATEGTTAWSSPRSGPS
jgi:hypothetical protein